MTDRTHSRMADFTFLPDPNGNDELTPPFPRLFVCRVIVPLPITLSCFVPAHLYILQFSFSPRHLSPLENQFPFHRYPTPACILHMRSNLLCICFPSIPHDAPDPIAYPIFFPNTPDSWACPFSILKYVVIVGCSNILFICRPFLFWPLWDSPE